MIRLLLMVALAQAPDGGAPRIDDLYTACGDAPLMEAVDGGYFVPERRQQRNNCKLTACEEYASQKLTTDTGAPPSTVLLLVGGGVGLVALGVVLGFFLPHPVK